RPQQGQPHGAHPVRCAHASPHRPGGRGGARRGRRARRHRRGHDGHLRPGRDGRHERVRDGDRRAPGCRRKGRPRDRAGSRLVTARMTTLRTPATPFKPAGTARQGFGATMRPDAWAIEPGIVAFGFSAFIVYSLFSALVWGPVFGVAYEANGYLSPFFSP